MNEHARNLSRPRIRIVENTPELSGKNNAPTTLPVEPIVLPVEPSTESLDDKEPTPILDNVKVKEADKIPLDSEKQSPSFGELTRRYARAVLLERQPHGESFLFSNSDKDSATLAQRIGVKLEDLVGIQDHFVRILPTVLTGTKKTIPYWWEFREELYTDPLYARLPIEAILTRADRLVDIAELERIAADPNQTPAKDQMEPSHFVVKTSNDPSIIISETLAWPRTRQIPETEASPSLVEIKTIGDDSNSLAERVRNKTLILTKVQQAVGEAVLAQNPDGGYLFDKSISETASILWPEEYPTSDDPKRYPRIFALIARFNHAQIALADKLDFAASLEGNVPDGSDLAQFISYARSLPGRENQSLEEIALELRRGVGEAARQNRARNKSITIKHRGEEVGIENPQEIEEILSAIKTSYRDALTLIYLQNKSVGDALKIVGGTKSALNITIFRARQAFIKQATIKGIEVDFR